jgi:hypothetical protein
MRGWKEIETRVHPNFTSLKGKRILIHAGQKIDRTDLAIQNPYLTKEQIYQAPEEIINGFILGTAYVYDFKKLNSSHSKKALIDCDESVIQRWGLFLSAIERYDTPIAAKGEMGIWYYDMEKEIKVKKNPTSQLNLF